MSATADFSAAIPSILWMAVIFVVLGIGMAVLAVLRRRLLGRSPGQDPALTLDELRRQRDNGVLSAAEYDLLRRHLVTKLTQQHRSTPEQPADKLVQYSRVS